MISKNRSNYIFVPFPQVKGKNTTPRGPNMIVSIISHILEAFLLMITPREKCTAQT